MYYLYLFIAFLIQDPISSNVLLLLAYQNGYNLTLVHLIFVIATIVSASICYFVGQFIQRKFINNRFVLWVKNKTAKFVSLENRNSKRLIMFIFGPMIFPLSALVAPWVGMKYTETLLTLLIGDTLIWYLGEWLVVLGVSKYTLNLKSAIIAILVIYIIMITIKKIIFKKVK